jgi:hypothetical protein
MGTDPHTLPSEPPGTRRSKWAFFTSVPGIVTVVAGLVTAIATIISQSGNIVGHFRPIPRPASELVKVKLDYPQVFPFGLRHLMGRSAYLKWSHVKVENRTNDHLILEMSFQVRRGPATEIASPPVQYWVDPREVDFERDPDPNIEFTTHEVQADDKLEIICRIVDDQQKALIFDDTRSIELLPENTVDWSLTALDGSPVPQDFLLASLTTWTVTADPTIVKLVEQLRHGTRSGADRPTVTKWFSQSYSRIFQNPSRVNVSAAPILFPAPARQTIRTPSQVLDRGEANELEAGLLIAALSRARFRNKVQLVLFAVPQNQNQPSLRNILLSWSTDDLNWQAIALAQANSLNFDDNEKSATAQVNKMLAEEPEILAALKGSGIFWTSSHAILGLNLLRADQTYHMTAWQ